MFSQVEETKDDLSIPARYIDGQSGLTSQQRELVDAWNRFALTERESRGKRTKIRLEFLVWMRTQRRLASVRLRCKHVTLSLPSAEQAELAIEIIRQVCKSMEGKHLVRAPKP